VRSSTTARSSASASPRAPRRVISARTKDDRAPASPAHATTTTTTSATMDTTPRRASVPRPPHTPAELNIVSRVGVAATAEGGETKGILCLKVSSFPAVGHRRCVTLLVLMAFSSLFPGMPLAPVGRSSAVGFLCVISRPTFANMQVRHRPSEPGRLCIPSPFPRT